MTQEQYVSFETAKLLKEKLLECHAFYVGDSKIFYYQHYHDFDRKDIIEAPTQQMAMRWLREHNIDIIPFHEIFDGDVYWCRIEKKYGNLLHTELQQDPVYKTYEEAVEEAIKYSLENLV